MNGGALGDRIRDLFVSGESGRGFVLALVFLLLAGLLVAGLAFVLYSRSSRGRLASLSQQRASASREGRWLIQAAALGLLFVGFFLGNGMLERPSTCARCHTNEGLYVSESPTPHDDLKCAECHRERGVTWRANQLVTYARWTYKYTAGGNKEPEPRPGSVASSACLRCHDQIRDITVQRGGIKVRHADFIDKVYACRDCHNAIIHPGVLKEATEPSMSKCVPCHDGRTAPSECDTCHAEDLGRPTALDAPLPKVELTAEKQYGACYECHAEKNCTSCHGIRMPHPPEWGTTGHQREGFANRTVCWRCHFEGDQVFVPSDASCSCHGLQGEMHGGTLWIREHGLQATGKKPGENSECFFCHSTSLCDLCHPASYKEMYNPRSGYDTYRPSRPAPPGAKPGRPDTWYP